MQGALQGSLQQDPRVFGVKKELVVWPQIQPQTSLYELEVDQPFGQVTRHTEFYFSFGFTNLTPCSTVAITVEGGPRK